MLETPKAPLLPSDNGRDDTMGNQQERLLSNDFIAGLITGEGTFTLAVYRSGKKVRIKPMFSLQMNDARTMSRVVASLQALGLPANFYHRPNRGCWTTQAAGFTQTRRYLEIFLPILSGTKQDAAQIVMDFIESRSKVSKFDPYSAEEVDLVEKIRTVNGVPGRKRNSLEGLREQQGSRQWKARAESSEANTLDAA